MSPLVSRRTVVAGLTALGLAATLGMPYGRSQTKPAWTVVHGPQGAEVSGHGAAESLLRDLARRADLAAARVGATLGTRVKARILVPADDREAAALARTGSVTGLTALADRGRVIVVPVAFARLTPTGRDVVLTHELTHVAAGTDGLPVWLREGFADYVAYRDAGLATRVAAAELAAEVRAGRLPVELPPDAAFGPGAVRLAATYQEAWLACRFLAERFGEERLVALYRVTGTRGLDRALAETVGWSLARLTRQWRGYVREQVG